jgi:hypothetical protein
MKRWNPRVITLAAIAAACALAGPPEPAPRAGAYRAADLEAEAFLQQASIVKRKGTNKGITGVVRATLQNPQLTHDGAISFIDEYKSHFQSPRGTELNFRDSWKYNIAAYRLDRLLGLNMVPVTVERKVDGKACSICWWVDGVQFDEGDRMKKKAHPPDLRHWNEQMWAVRVFDQLIFNTDRNLGNLLIDKDWRIWMIDHTRAFRTHEDLRELKNLEKCERRLLENLKRLDRETLQRELGRHLTGGEIGAILKRRDKIVAFFEKQGDSALYDMASR